MNVKCFVNEIDFSCNVYICSDEKRTFIVDLGYYDEKIKNYLSSVPKVLFVLQTHGHFDHTMGLDAFIKDFPGTPVYIFSEEIEVAKNPVYNGAHSMLGNFYAPQVELLPLKAGNNRLFDFEVKVIHTPGHTKGSCMYYFNEDKLLFTGDTIIETSIGRTDLPTGDEATLFRSLKKFMNLSFDDDVTVLSGHGSFLTYKELIKHNHFLR